MSPLGHLSDSYLKSQRDTFVEDESMGDEVAVRAVSANLAPDSWAARGWVLVVGCKTGAEALAIREKGYQNIVCLDLFPQLAFDKGLPSVIADMSSLPFSNSSFRVVYSRDSLEHSPDLFGSLYEFHRVLDPSGRLYLSVPCDKDEEYHQSVLCFEEWQSAVRAFFLIEHEEYVDNQYTIVARPSVWFSEYEALTRFGGVDAT